MLVGRAFRVHRGSLSVPGGHHLATRVHSARWVARAPGVWYEDEVAIGPAGIVARAGAALPAERIDGAALFFNRGQVNKLLARHLRPWPARVQIIGPLPFAMVLAVTEHRLHLLEATGAANPLRLFKTVALGDYRAAARRRPAVVWLDVETHESTLRLETKRWGFNRHNPAVVRLVLQRSQDAA